MYVKDMQRVGRQLENTIIIDNSPNSYQFQPENGIPILSWYDNPNDNELLSFVPALKLLADERIDDVRPIILQSVINNEFHPQLCAKICQHVISIKEQVFLEHQKRMQQYQMQQTRNRDPDHISQISYYSNNSQQRDGTVKINNLIQESSFHSSSPQRT